MQALQNVAVALMAAIWYKASANEAKASDTEQAMLAHAWLQHLVAQHLQEQQQEQSKTGVQTTLMKQEEESSPIPTNMFFGIVPALHAIVYCCRVTPSKDIAS